MTSNVVPQENERGQGEAEDGQEPGDRQQLSPDGRAIAAAANDHHHQGSDWPVDDPDSAGVWALMLVPIAICLALAIYASIFG